MAFTYAVCMLMSMSTFLPHIRFCFNREANQLPHAYNTKVNIKNYTKEKINHWVDENTEHMIDEIIDVASELGVDLSPLDATNIAIYTLHGIITAPGNVEIDAIKKSICEIIGDPDKIGNYLFTSLAGISATDDAIIDEKFAEKGVV